MTAPSTSARWGRMRGPILAAVVAGAGLRLALPTVFTYLDDERWTFEHVASALRGGGLETLGMPSSTGVRNAPLSVWAFVAVGWLGHVSTPVGLTRGVAVLGLVALIAGLAFLPRLVPTDAEGEAWAWGLVLTSTNPAIVFLERKIWAQSLLPAIDVALLCAWMRRERSAASFAWGLLGPIAGQIHMAGF
ncbi:MAG TPA: hypothetical protein VKU41_31860, partial [Polyangiaceae bacterium]|nr:hypothetical protein [Polyangiaceae bacterium]